MHIIQNFFKKLVKGKQKMSIEWANKYTNLLKVFTSGKQAMKATGKWSNLSPLPSPLLSFPFKKKQYKENQATQNQRSQDQTFSTKKERLRNPNVDSYQRVRICLFCDSYPNISQSISTYAHKKSVLLYYICICTVL